MNIGFDLDKIFINYPPLIPAVIIDRLYKAKSNGTLQYRIPSKPEQIVRIISHYWIFRPPIKENIEFFKKIAQENKNKYFLISSRFGFLRKRTENILKRNGLDGSFTKMIFNYNNKQPHLFKNYVLKKYTIDKYVDDDLALLKFLYPKHINTTFYWLNKNISKQLGKNLFAITHLEQMI